MHYKKNLQQNIHNIIHSIINSISGYPNAVFPNFFTHGTYAGT